MIQPFGAMADALGADVTGGEMLLAFTRLPLATALASLLALRPRRRGTPARNLAVIHSQIILAVVGALVMLVVGQSLARAFGIVGAAGLVRYRAKIDDPKDAGVMLSTLAVGLATGVGQWPLAIFGTVFLLALLWIVESFEPAPKRSLTIKVKTKDAATLKGQVEALLGRQRASYELRALSPEEMHYEVQWPGDRPADRLSEELAALDPSRQMEVEIETPKKEK
jgi:uncharacterized membrane protein YhiD involved in acid resistance